VLTMQVVAKNAGTAQTCYNSFRAHASGDSPILTVGAAEATRPWTAARVVWNLVWTPNPPGDVIASINVAPIINEIVARSDYQPGGFITLMMYTDNENGSDMGVRANNDFAPTWGLTVDFTENYVTDLQTSFNLINNPHNELMPAIDAASPLPYWGQNPYFGAMVDPANQGVIARDTSFTRVPGVATMRFTTGTPPDASQATKATGPYTTTIKQNEFPYIFAGWIYIPSAITARVWCGDPYLGNSHDITARNQWVPFCSTPSQVGTGRGTFWPAVRIMGPYQAGWQLWVSEPTVMVSPFRQMPFSGLTPDVTDPGGSVLVDHKYVGSGQGAVREWLPRTGVIRQGTLRRVPRYIKRPDGILQLAEPVKGGVTSPNMPAIPMNSYPIGKTVSEI
jgi:hypothetical protein